MSYVVELFCLLQRVPHPALLCVVTSYGADSDDVEGVILETVFEGLPLVPNFAAYYITNWNTDNVSSRAVSVMFAGAAESTDFDIPPLGCIIIGGNASTASGSDVLGGFFMGTYNSVALAPGLHVIAEDRVCNAGSSSDAAVCVYHPFGADTSVTVALPLSLQHLSVLVVSALNASMGVIAVVSNHINGAFISFAWQREVDGMAVTSYKISP